MIGPGIYDHLCTHVREETAADAVIVIVLGGNKGSGMSAQGSILAQAQVPEMLEHAARMIRDEWAKEPRQ